MAVLYHICVLLAGWGMTNRAEGGMMINLKHAYSASFKTHPATRLHTVAKRGSVAELTPTTGNKVRHHLAVAGRELGHVRRPLAEDWVTPGGIRHYNHHSPKSISSRFSEPSPIR